MELAIYNFIAFFVIIDPPGTAALFAVMTRSMPAAQRRQIAVRATLLAGLILLLFGMGGEVLLTVLGITLPAFRIAGGILLFMLATDMIFARQTGLRSMTQSEGEEWARRDDITVFPLAFPLIAGPGAMTSVVLLMGRAGGEPMAVALVVLELMVVLAILLVLLLGAGRVLRILGVTGSNVIGRVLGIILAALAAQFVLDGLREAGSF